MNARSRAAKTAWTPERRERQRVLARQLIAEGKFGGPQGKPGGGRPRKRAPSGKTLLRILEVHVSRSSSSFPAAQHVVNGMRSFSRIAHLLGIDRSQFEALLVSGVETAIADKQLSQFVLFREDESVVTPAKGSYPPAVLKAWRNNRDDAKDLIVLRELARVDVRRFSDAELVEALVLLQFVSTRPLLRSAIAVALGELAARMGEEVHAEQGRRA